MKQVTVAVIFLLGTHSLYACGIKELSSKNYDNCLDNVLIKNEVEAVKFCLCIERNMDWDFMYKNKKMLDLKKCEFTELRKLITEKEATDKCDPKKILNP